MAPNDIAKRYVELCKAGKNDVCLDELYAKDAVSVEAVAQPGTERVVKGLEGIRAKSKTWRESNVIHSAEVMGPFPHDNRFAVRFTFDVTNKPAGRRIKMDEIGLFTIENGKIAREEFFYSTEG
jgi:hypothetical protein